MEGGRERQRERELERGKKRDPFQWNILQTGLLYISNRGLLLFIISTVISADRSAASKEPFSFSLCAALVHFRTFHRLLQGAGHRGKGQIYRIVCTFSRSRAQIQRWTHWKCFPFSNKMNDTGGNTSCHPSNPSNPKTWTLRRKLSRDLHTYAHLACCCCCVKWLRESLSQEGVQVDRSINTSIKKKSLALFG